MGIFPAEGRRRGGGSKPNARAAGMQQTQHGIERGASELRGMLGLTFGLDTLIADMQLLMPYCT